MAKYHNVLQNIKKVEVIEARYLNDITVILGLGVMLNYWRNFTEIPLSDLAEVEINSIMENKCRIYSLKLSFHTPDSFDAGMRDLCYRVTTVHGSQFLIGTSLHPFPVTSSTELFPSSVTAKSGTSVEVTYKNTHGMLSILDK